MAACVGAADEEARELAMGKTAKAKMQPRGGRKTWRSAMISWRFWVFWGISEGMRSLGEIWGEEPSEFKGSRHQHEASHVGSACQGCHTMPKKATEMVLATMPRRIRARSPIDFWSLGTTKSKEKEAFSGGS